MSHPIRLKLSVRGAVQGVGFRPFVYRLATELGLAGSVRNTSRGLLIEVEGEEQRVQSFLSRLPVEAPQHAVIQGIEPRFLDIAGFRGFRIDASEPGAPSALILPDLATCPSCRAEIFNPADRRYRYPFTNCTHCGPRFSIILALPYDRANTTMRDFPLCPSCASEFQDPLDRRFHAQPTACPECGPRLEYRDDKGGVVAEGDEALRESVERLRCGGIVALKGIGGFQLLVDAGSAAAVDRLRNRKRRDEKPFAVLFPDLPSVLDACEADESETRLLTAPQAPILLLRKRSSGAAVDELVAPGNPCLGAMLPYSPLHLLLASDFGAPLVATSGNLSDEPICIGNAEALDRLSGIADGFLCHNRPIARQVDDSVVRVVHGRELVLRRARGYAPLPLSLQIQPGPVLAVGGHLKNTVAVSVGTDVFLSQHVGDLDTEPARAALERTADDFCRLYEVQPRAVACDQHPDYASTRFATGLSLPVFPVQHHVAHVLSCMAENELSPPCLGISWDGTGWGPDGTVWGGEFLRILPGRFERTAHFRPFPLPGGEQAVREPRRSALGLLFEMLDGRLEEAPPILRSAFSSAEWRTLSRMLERGVNCPRTSSAGRLFDAVASLLGLRHATRYEGQAAMQVEFAADTGKPHPPLSFPLRRRGDSLLVDWGPGIRELLGGHSRGRPISELVAQFHEGLAQAATAVALEAGECQVVMSGGCFQNRLLAESMTKNLERAGFRVYRHQRVPPNDGGIALGQLAAVAWGIRSENHVSGGSGSNREYRG